MHNKTLFIAIKKAYELCEITFRKWLQAKLTNMNISARTKK